MCVTGAGGSSEGAGPSSGTLSKAKLPKLDLPVFKDDITEWTTFWDMYESAVHIFHLFKSLLIYVHY